MYKLGHIENSDWVEHVFPAVFHLPDRADEVQRIVAGVPAGDPTVFERLTCCLEEPYFLLYVLHTPRGEGAPGRYQSPALSRPQVRDFVARFSALLSGDARFDLWSYSLPEKSTIVWDRHNLLYAYGPLDRYVVELKALGFVHGEVIVPAPHSHEYRQELDTIATALLSAFDWSHAPLQPEDEQ